MASKLSAMVAYVNRDVAKGVSSAVPRCSQVLDGDDGPALARTRGAVLACDLGAGGCRWVAWSLGAEGCLGGKANWGSLVQLGAVGGMVVRGRGGAW